MSHSTGTNHEESSGSADRDDLETILVDLSGPSGLRCCARQLAHLEADIDDAQRVDDQVRVDVLYEFHGLIRARFDELSAEASPEDRAHAEQSYWFSYSWRERGATGALVEILRDPGEHEAMLAEIRRGGEDE